ncbi:hypothetical protein ARALYDRAFT_487162 [Arabidopsis lyrata subsp. lyrata]|uniref:Uncharacterized protein n=1 Tax=Arabidopsis lyrata subsp. lyrata TaxID=81972 RepID=D7LWU2_ARALL|nr:hypothetical protein ARALYDRAFT_487162 [Arabidopsis lyrata subsp. lyrata]
MPRRPSGRRRLSKYQPLAFSPFMRSLTFASTARRKLPLPDISFDSKYPNLSIIGKSNNCWNPLMKKTLRERYILSWIADDEDDALFALVTALNLARYKASHLVEVIIMFKGVCSYLLLCFADNKCFRELKEFLLKVCSEKNVASDLELLVEKKAKDVGLLVSQRVMNLPPQLLPPLYDGLFDEVSWATEDEPTEQLRGSFRFKSYILITKIHKLTSWSFTFPIHSQLGTSQEAQEIPEFRQRLKSLIDEQ